MAGNVERRISIPMFIVDAFSKYPFGGNGAAICFLNFGEDVSTKIMQKIAAEMKLSETAFASILNAGDSFSNGKRFGLRWFTPTHEVSLCGHATLATAAVIFSEFRNSSAVIEFETMSGVLSSSKVSGKGFSIDLPAYECKPVDTKLFHPLITAAIGSLPFKGAFLSSSKKFLIQMENGIDRKTFEGINPSMDQLMSATPEGVEVIGVIITSVGSGKSDFVNENGTRYDFISRYFVPWLGVPEDPVTGSAHAVLGPFWAKVLGKTEFFARQCSPRGGELHITIKGNRVDINGEAVVVLKGNFYLTK